MGEAHRFRTIKEYRIQKFDQDKAGGLTFHETNLNITYCVGICFAWIESKLTRPNRLEKLLGSRRGWSNIFSQQDGEEGQEDVDYRLYIEGNRLGNFYQPSTDADIDNFDDLVQNLPSITVTRTTAATLGSSVNEVDAVVRGLPKGHAALIGFRFIGGRHAVAAYHSRGNNIYFFDPGAGVYAFKPIQSLQFFTGWTSCYERMGRSIVNSYERGFRFSVYGRA